MPINSNPLRLFAFIAVASLVCVSISCSDKKTKDKTIAPEIVTTATAIAVAGELYSYTIIATGTPAPTVTVSGLPSWLSYNTTAQTISGTPAVNNAGTTGAVTVTATNGVNPPAVQTFAIIVYDWMFYGDYAVVDLVAPYAITNLSSSPADLHTHDAYKTTKLVLKRIASGTFQMGDQTSAGTAIELPVHPASITKDFYIGVFETTQQQWYEVKGAWPSFFTTLPDKRPVERVSWNDIKGGSGFIDTLSFLIGETFDLPTEAEWEYCCKAGTSTNYSYGSTADGAYMWYFANSGTQTKDVGAGLPNPWGLYDMHGNVWEWCLDYGSLTYYQTCYDAGTVSDPKGPLSGSQRVIRGGAWGETASYCRSSNRGATSQDAAADHLGFRIVAVRRD